MGYLYELAVTPFVMVRKHYGRGLGNGVMGPEQRIPFGGHRQQRFSYWEPAQGRHAAVVLYYHGGGFVFGESESMADAAALYNAMGYRFCSIGFREAPFAKFPAQIDDAFEGLKAAVAWLKGRGIDCSRLIIGGTSAGGMLAYLVCYARPLQRRYGIERLVRRIAGCVSIAGVSDACDLIVKPFPAYWAWRTCVRVPCHGRSRQAMRRAVAPYSPVAVVQRAVRNGRDGASAQACEKECERQLGRAERRAASDSSASEMPVGAVDTEPPIPLVPAFIMHGRADRLAPFSSQVRFVEALTGAIGADCVAFCVLRPWRWQHMLLTVSLHKRDPRTFEPLGRLFRWLAQCDRADDTPGEREA